MKKKMIFRDFSDFSIAGNNWKKKLIIIKNEKKKNVQNLKGATAHLSRRLGAGALGRAGVGAGLGAGHWARGRVAGAGRAWARGPALQAAKRAGRRCRQLGARAGAAGS